MRIICPCCSSHYEVDAGEIGADGHLVRCTACREVWLARRPDPAPPQLATVAGGRRAADDAAPPVDFARAKARLRPPPALDGSAGRGALGALVLAGAVLCAAAAALGGRAAIARHVPGAGAVYAAMGLPVNTLGLALRDVRGSLVAEDGRTVLMLQGSISNLRGGPTPVPRLTVQVRDGSRAPLYTWTEPAPKARLAGGETVAFRSRLAAPPATGQDVRVTFADASGS